jgi:hypothetical protein
MLNVNSRQRKKRGSLLWVVLLLLSLGLGGALSLSACAGCIFDADCPNGLRCGAGRYCMTRCFPGERMACAREGEICNQNGDACVPGQATPDGGGGD